MNAAEILTYPLTLAALVSLVAWLLILADEWCEAKGLPHPIVAAWRLLWAPLWLVLVGVRWAVLRLLHVLACLVILATQGKRAAAWLWCLGAEDWA